jgi:hypothetical protein
MTGICCLIRDRVRRKNSGHVSEIPFCLFQAKSAVAMCPAPLRKTDRGDGI